MTFPPAGFSGRAIAVAIAASIAPAQAQVGATWVQFDGGAAVSRDAADHVFTARGDANLGGDITVTKRDAAGNLLWKRFFDNTDSTRSEIATWVATDRSGATYVSGTISSGFSNPVSVNALLMKFAGDGTLLWRRVLGTPFDGSRSVKVVLDAQDNAYLFGLGQSGTGLVSTLHKLAPDGTLLWTWHDRAGIGAPVNAKTTPDGQLLVVGRATFGSINGYARVDAQGTTVWTMAGITSLAGGDAAGDAAGNTYLVNSGAASGTTALRKLSSSGVPLWERSAALVASRVEVAPDGGAVIAGFPGAGFGAAFAAFGADGSARWINTDADGPSVAQLAPAQLLIDAAGSAYLAGTTLSAMSVTKVAAGGGSAWTLQFGTGGATSLVLGSMNQLYVGGSGAVARLDQGGAPPPPPPPPPPPVVDVGLSLSAAPSVLKTNGAIVYTASVRNLGNGGATAVGYVLTLPPQVAWRATRTSQGSCSGRQPVTCTLGSIAPGAAATVTVTVQARRRGTATATGVATASGDMNPANDRASASTTIGR